MRKKRAKPRVAYVAYSRTKTRSRILNFLHYYAIFLDFLDFFLFFLVFLTLFLDFSWFSWFFLDFFLFFLDFFLRLFPFLLVRPPRLSPIFHYFFLEWLSSLFYITTRNFFFGCQNPGKTREKPGKIFLPDKPELFA